MLIQAGWRAYRGFTSPACLRPICRTSISDRYSTVSKHDGTLLVAGAGIAGSTRPLALARPGREVIVLDRDPPPPDIDPDTPSLRMGTQGRHPASPQPCLPRPAGQADPRQPPPALDRAAGLRGARVHLRRRPAARPPKSLRRPPGDEDMSFLFSRRSTLELIMRRYAQTLPASASCRMSAFAASSPRSGGLSPSPA